LEKKRCKGCGCLFKPGLRHPNQKYCTKEKCQKARKAKWQRDKLASDELYRQNQYDCRDRWLEKNPDYWKNYRENHPDYTQRNREMQRVRNRIRRCQNATKSISPPIANMDVVNENNLKISGRYKLIPCDGKMVANMDVVIVEINDITDTYIQK
jgi:hypothetical protein